MVEALLRERYAAQRATPEPAQLELVARYLDGDVSADERARVDALFDADPELAEAAALARDEAGERKVVSLGAARQARKRPPMAFMVAMAAAILAVVGVSLYVGGGPASHDETPMSGAGVGVGASGDQLIVRVHGPGGDSALSVGGPLPQAGDTLTLEISAKLPGHLMVVELDGAGAVRVIYPTEGDAAAAVAPTRREALPPAAKVGERRGCAWIVGVFSDRPFTRAELDAAGLADATAATVDCAPLGLGARLPFARSVVSWPVHR
ncbi:MAG: hypothetical protein CVU56_02580 [Deltaproteobacteria bacterium HGW-Deltaproteobacteria-14]|jgi:hypothetical protein|nr:MAG: hypothetical protein CVU56_02580 [Deltaproteobacteria bacterium HGW-Deltaproteobacteria-14]